MRKEGSLLGILVLLLFVAPLTAQFSRPRPPKVQGGNDVEHFRESWRVLEPITRRNLSIYLVVSASKADTSQFITLDEGISSGVVRILERGQLGSALYRRRDSHRWPPQRQAWPDDGGARVNELVLVNDSPQPLILLAGEVVSGGKQNRIIGADVVVPPKSDPIPLTVFCVEHGRWSAGGGAFSSAKAMAHPGIRKEAQANKSQAGVWEMVARSAAAMAAPSSTQDYAGVLNSARAKRELERVATSIEADYERELRAQLRGRGAVGVVVAIDGELVWSDVFTSADLFRKYWPKLLRSYVLEASGRGGAWREIKSVPPAKDAEAFLLEDQGHVSVKMEPGAFRRTEISANDYQVVALEALGKFEEAGLLLHYNKMARS